MKREIIVIDEEKCTGCGECIPGCPEGALQVIDGKCRLVSDLLCDGLGACVGHCPEGAMRIEVREAEPYDERKVMAEHIVPRGKNMIRAHLEHLRAHGQDRYLAVAVRYLEEEGIPVPAADEPGEVPCACPGTAARVFEEEEEEGPGTGETGRGRRGSRLRQWPIQFHLVSPLAPYFQGKDVLLAADCTAYALGDFHEDFLAGRSLIIACPKLDTRREVYVDKLVSLLDEARIAFLTVLVMEVPCCRGLVMLVERAREKAARSDFPVRVVTVSLKGEVLSEEEI